MTALIRRLQSKALQEGSAKHGRISCNKVQRKSHHRSQPDIFTVFRIDGHIVNIRAAEALAKREYRDDPERP